jgi:hypothetical protein
VDENILLNILKRRQDMPDVTTECGARHASRAGGADATALWARISRTYGTFASKSARLRAVLTSCGVTFSDAPIDDWGTYAVSSATAVFPDLATELFVLEAFVTYQLDATLKTRDYYASHWLWSRCLKRENEARMLEDPVAYWEHVLQHPMNTSDMRKIDTCYRFAAEEELLERAERRLEQLWVEVARSGNMVVRFVRKKRKLDDMEEDE